MSGLVLSMGVLVEGLDHPEGVAFDHTTGRLYAGGEQGQIYQVDIGTRSVQEKARTPGFALGLAVDGRGRVAVCDSEDGAVWAWDGVGVLRVADEVEGWKMVMPNYGAFGPDGTLYLSDSGKWNHDIGAVLAVAPDGSGHVVDTSLKRFPNGCAVTPDGSELWVLQSEGQDLSRIDLVRGGTAEQIVSLAGTVPDGIALTDDGGAVISCYRPDRLYYLDPTGHLEILADDPQGTLLAAPTNVCFVGSDRRTLVTANLGRWHLTILETMLTGVVPHAPLTWALDAKR